MENADGVGTVTPAMVEARARKLAVISGRDSSKPTKADYQQAKRELTGEEEIDPEEENVQSVPESEGWDPVQGSTDGKQRNLSVKMKMPKDGAKARRCSKKGSTKRARSNASGSRGRAEKRRAGIVTLMRAKRSEKKQASR